MSSSSSSKEESGKRTKSNALVPIPTPAIYPPIPGYQFYPFPWSPHPYMPNEASYAPWTQGAWNHHGMCPVPSGYWFSGEQDESLYPRRHDQGKRDDYTLDSLRHIYSDKNGSFEFERVKFQKGSAYENPYVIRRSILPTQGGPSNTQRTNITPDGKVPPPRKKKKKRQLKENVVPPMINAFPPRYPYPSLPYYPPYPCTFAYMPPPPFALMPPHYYYDNRSDHFSSDERRSNQSSSPQDDWRGYKREMARSQRASSGDNERPNADIPQSVEKHIRSTDIEEVGANSKEKHRRRANGKERAKTSEDYSTERASCLRRKDNPSSREVSVSPCAQSEDGNSLVSAFRSLEETIDAFKCRISEQTDSTDKEESLNVTQADTASICSLTHSVRTTETVQEDDIVESEATEKTLKEEDKESQDSPWDSGDEDYPPWILKGGGRRGSDSEDESDHSLPERIQSWRAEVSMWRASLIVSICNGQGMDQENWDSFQMLVQHPLPIEMKFSLLSARRFCSANSGVGVTVLRNALVFFIKCGETVLKNEPSGSRTPIVVEPKNDVYMKNIKGSNDIMRILGFIYSENILKHRGRSTDTNIAARLILDLLVLSEELRLYLAGKHSYPGNITKLFIQPNATPFIEEIHSEKADSVTMPDSSTTSESSSMPTVVQKIIDLKTEGTEPDMSQTSNSGKCSQVTDSSANEPADHVLKVSESPPVITENCLSNSLTALHISEASLNADTNEELSKKDHSKSQNKDRKSKIGSDEHIYEEICELKTQEKGDDKDELTPPSLPPKTKKSISTKSHPSEFSISNNISPLPRKKKRRAPMPPEFDNTDIPKIDGEIITERKPDFRSTNPFYEVTKPSGYIGKNPFYEDAVPLDQEVKGSEIETQKESVKEMKDEKEADVFLPPKRTKNDARIFEWQDFSKIRRDAATGKRIAPAVPSHKHEQYVSDRKRNSNKQSNSNSGEIMEEKTNEKVHLSEQEKEENSVSLAEPIPKEQDNTIVSQIKDEKVGSPKKIESDGQKTVKISVSQIETKSEDKTPSLLPKAPLKLVDDIPYIDTSDVHEYKKLFSKDVSDTNNARLDDRPPTPPSTSPPKTPEDTPSSTPVPESEEMNQNETEVSKDSGHKGELSVVEDASNRNSSTVSVEERYEIPDVTRAEANARLYNMQQQNSIPTRTGLPIKRNIWGKYSHPFKVPPRPPKPQGRPPPLPPKTPRFKDSLWHTLPTVSQPKDKHSPSSSSTRQKSSTLPCQKTAQAEAVLKMSLPGTAKPQAKRQTVSASVPSSPEMKKKRSELQKVPKDSKTRKSWSCLLCDCIYVNVSSKKKK